ncbi:hypothetical protein INT47_008473 [Mucor saturninus]|uniref:Uncharacterized protein n=1 Tax=Mucor saturninus TaxID=64648 RepID=A0A8H7R9T4_9FUNG|nr:hypothetical protein INT47_008473 [Mucor saturninus]
MDEELFPHSNKYETKKKTIAEESKQWESLFDPQYTFGSFQHGIAKPVTDVYYKGKWPLDEKDTRPDTVEEPTLPDIQNIQLMHRPTDNEAEIEILPRPFPKYDKHTDETSCCSQDRLELRRILQEVGFNKKNDGTHNNPYKQYSTAARFQQQIINKTKQMKQEIMLDHHDTIDSTSMEDLCEKSSFTNDEPTQQQGRRNRASFLYFALGFLFPPFWLIGALYVPSSQRTSAILITILVLIMKPDAVGFRNSNEDGYQHPRVVFDDDITPIS